jgi:hypothetical protein
MGVFTFRNIYLSIAGEDKSAVVSIQRGATASS